MDKGLVGNIVYNELRPWNSIWKRGCVYVYYNMLAVKGKSWWKLKLNLKQKSSLKQKLNLKPNLKQTTTSKNLFQRNSNSWRQNIHPWK